MKMNSADHKMSSPRSVTEFAWAVVSQLINLFAAGTEQNQIDGDGDLTGVFNFRTRQFDNGTDPHGWYEDDQWL